MIVSVTSISLFLLFLSFIVGKCIVVLLLLLLLFVHLLWFRRECSNDDKDQEKHGSECGCCNNGRKDAIVVQ